jgi:beta-N-acetylhexosaminidase
MIMATDVLVPAVDPRYPAELSPVWITTVLRQQLGYDGVVITDSLWMQGIAARWDLATAAVQAILAGDDVVMAAYDAASTQRVLNALKAALATGRLTRERLAQSVRRVLTLKLAHGLLPIPPEVVAAQSSADLTSTP